MRKLIISIVLVETLVLIGCGGSGKQENLVVPTNHNGSATSPWGVLEELDSPLDRPEAIPTDEVGVSWGPTCISEPYNEQDTMFIVPVKDMEDLVNSRVIDSPIGRQIWMHCSDGTYEPTDDFYHMNQGEYSYYLYMRDKLPQTKEERRH